MGSEPAPTPAGPGCGRPRGARRRWSWVRPVGGLAIIVMLLWRLGTGPFLDGLRLVDARTLAVAVGIGVPTTVCGAWRWSLIARGLGVRLPLGTAVAHCYRSVFLNATLPGGVLGDVHRAVRHGRDAGDVGRGVRAVVWERTAGQVVQVVIALVVLSACPSPVRSYLPAATAVVVGAGLVGVLLARAAPRRGPSRWARVLRAARADIRDGLLARRTWLGVVVASALVVAGHVATFLVAARTASPAAPLLPLVPLTLLALLAMAVPVNVAGFGPREGVAAWAFGAAGLAATQGVSTAVVYGALVLAASLPGAGVLVARHIPWRGPSRGPSQGEAAPPGSAPPESAATPEFAAPPESAARSEEGDRWTKHYLPQPSVRR